jgi:hypothetical protein
MRVALAFAMTVPLAGCGWLSNSFAFVGDAFGFGAGGEGLPYRATAAQGDDPRELVVSVPAGPTVALDDMRESARFPVTRYCIANFGTSQAEWVTDPATDDWAVTRTENGALLQARCMGRA